MSSLFAWLPRDVNADAGPVVAAMAAALVVHARQQSAITVLPGLGIGTLEPPPLGAPSARPGSATTDDGRYRLWMAGEVFAASDPDLEAAIVNGADAEAFRRLLLQQWLRKGADAVRDLDGEYHVAVWDRTEQTLSIANDRFGGLPLYWAQSPEGVAIAGGVRGVLMAPGVGARPDPEALREAMTFGGYRLGARTNVVGVQMVAGGSVVTIRQDGLRSRRYWTWNDIPARAVSSAAQAAEALAPLWRTAIARRMRGPGRFGQTLSGGLDSRAILAEAAPGRDWTAITYGVAGCDDARYAERAAREVGARWVFKALYAGAHPDWLDRRSAFIQPTDGLMQLGDLMHLESLDAQREFFDVHLSGYVGDAVSGPTFGDVATAEAALLACPFYGVALGLPWEAALDRVGALVGALDGAAARFMLFEHKLPQSTNRWPTAWRPWLRVRKPFLDYAFFDFCQGLPRTIRVEGRLHEQWLRAAYPGCFATIPNHKTGLPVMASAVQVQIARAVRRGRSLASRVIPPVWRPSPRIRAYHDDDRAWRQPGIVNRISDTILRSGGLCCDILGRDGVTSLIDGWRATAAAPAQVIGALYVYETYHRDLAETLHRGARDAAAVRRAERVSL